MCLICPSHSPSLTEIDAGTQTEQETGNRQELKQRH